MPWLQRLVQGWSSRPGQNVKPVPGSRHSDSLRKERLPDPRGSSVVQDVSLCSLEPSRGERLHENQAEGRKKEQKEQGREGRESWIAYDIIGSPGSAVPVLISYASNDPVTLTIASASFLCRRSRPRRAVVDWRSAYCHRVTRGPAAVWDQTILCGGAILCVVGL